MQSFGQVIKFGVCATGQSYTITKLKIKGNSNMKKMAQARDSINKIAYPVSVVMPGSHESPEALRHVLMNSRNFTPGSHESPKFYARLS